MSIIDTLLKIINELNSRCFDESAPTGNALRPFVLECDGEETCVKFLGNPVLAEVLINDGNDPDEAAWRKFIEDEAIDYLTSIRTFTIRDEAKDTGRCTGKA